MGCGPKGNCKQAYRAPGKNTVHCTLQEKNGGQWDFCAHQYFCQRTNRWELSAQATKCPLLGENKTGKPSVGKKKSFKKKKAEPEKESVMTAEYTAPEDGGAAYEETTEAVPDAPVYKEMELKFEAPKDGVEYEGG